VVSTTNAREQDGHVNAALHLKGITKTFGDTIAVRDMDLVVPAGALYGVIGPNGAGKTTCIRMIMSILFPDSGELDVLGHPSALEAKDRIGYLPEERGVYRKMRVGTFLAYIGRLKGLTADEAATRARALLERVGLPGVERKRCEELSKGMLQRVQIAAAIIHRPDLLILDEPFSGLDPVSVRLLREMVLEEHRRGATILFSTHVMSHAEEICQHVVMIHRGRKVLDEPMARLRRRFDPRIVRVEPLDAAADVSSRLALPAVEQVTRRGDGYEILLRESADPAAFMQAVVERLPVARLELSRLTLEDIFVRVVSDGDAEDGALRASLRVDAEGVTA
jgi:ABC-2 type transport system ATP-binding protein